LKAVRCSIGQALAAMTWRNVSSGSFIIRVTVDPNNHIDESNETNNVSDFPVTVP